MIEEAGGLGLRKGNWKFVQGNKKNGGGELYDLNTDVGEQKNVIATHPEIAAEMRATLTQWSKAKDGIRKLGH